MLCVDVQFPVFAGCVWWCGVEAEFDASVSAFGAAGCHAEEAVGVVVLLWGPTLLYRHYVCPKLLELVLIVAGACHVVTPCGLVECVGIESGCGDVGVHWLSVVGAWASVAWA